MPLATIKWVNNSIKLIDQRKLPGKLEYIYCRDLETLWDAIKTLSVRGAPALGVASALGMLLASKLFKGNDKNKFLKFMEKSSAYIGSSRPTAVNLFNSLARIEHIIKNNQEKAISEIKKLVQNEAIAIYEEDRIVCRKMGKFGASFIKNGGTYMTICNAGSLATVDYGTALGVFYAAQEQKKQFKVYSLETRPLLQGARLTSWELKKSGVDVTLICDNMAASVMRNQRIDGIFAGADRIASNGDTANKIGTYSLGVLARFHEVPFYIVAPYSTFDLNIKDGTEIPIEQRSKEEVVNFHGVRTAPDNIKVFNPAFDVTPNYLIKAIITEEGIISPVNRSNISHTFGTNAKK
ncbi:MAG: S-methyl-5-thioribose-1-phosphate isomerase [Candidatus Omnitrophica bacterium]|nr:S-methyl-5-thioribose-1-phosphate isomerase [Candidatus Omnitrophota bacterium]